MPTYVASQIDKVRAKEMQVEISPGEFTIGLYQSMEPNTPMNLDLVITFGKCIKPGKVTSSMGPIGARLPDANYPTIVFRTNTGALQTWHYPPTAEGEARRNADFNYLLEQYVKLCPIDNPLAEA